MAAHNQLGQKGERMAEDYFRLRGYTILHRNWRHLHLEVDPHLTVLESHEIARAVKRHLKSRLDWVADVLVHVEPHLKAEPVERS